MFAVEAPGTWVWMRISPGGWSLPRTSPPSTPRSGKEAGGAVHGELRIPRSKERDHIRTPLLLLIGDVPLMGRDRGRSPGRVPGGREAGAAGPPGPQLAIDTKWL